MALLLNVLAGPMLLTEGASMDIRLVATLSTEGPGLLSTRRQI